ncbi:conserved hypothetical protein [Hyella patelloides LEGE 07179]|uniref:Thylakoid lumen protein n=1 Tax=Hyella patelloides LEGE 07179 TaxID=945734 RepID=A0A563VMJ3_9CYAN|nr:hypothetical protein [Hyella patelloides]VEP12638.1 conserved hypothetical protein [Hyella patelloides LEGE 07179]
MSNPVIDAFFLGRALAEVVGEKLEDAYTNALSELGKFDAEQRENLRAFIEEVQLRAQQSASSEYTTDSTSSQGTETSGDLQEMLDQLRAEIAELRAELKQYRN